MLLLFMQITIVLNRNIFYSDSYNIFNVLSNYRNVKTKYIIFTTFPDISSSKNEEENQEIYPSPNAFETIIIIFISTKTDHPLPHHKYIFQTIKIIPRLFDIQMIGAQGRVPPVWPRNFHESWPFYRGNHLQGG